MAVNFTGSLAISGSLTATSTITAQTLVVQTITSSVVQMTGSNIFGSTLANTQTFTGSMLVTGSGTFASSLTATSIIADGTSNEGTIRIERDTVSSNTTIGSLIFTNNNAVTTYGKVFGGRNSAGDGYVALGTGVSSNLYALESGNVGIGTPSPDRLLQISNTSGQAVFSIISATNDSADVFFGDTNNKAKTVLRFINGANTFNILQGGSTRMTITTSGSIGIGTTDPTTPLHLNGSAAAMTRITSTYSLTSGYADAFQMLFSNQTGGGLSLNIGKAESQNDLAKMVYFHVSNGSTSNRIGFGFYNNDALFNILASGNVGIGTSTPDCLLQAKGTDTLNANTRYLKTHVGGAGTWGSNSFEELGVGFSGIRSIYINSDNWDLGFSAGTSTTFAAGTQPERMRITSGGYVYINTTSNPLPDNATPQFGVLAGAGTDAVNIKHTVNGNNTFNLWQTGTTSCNMIAFYKGDTQTNRGLITVTTSGTTYNSVSDYRLKENIVPLENGLDRVLQLKPSKFNWIETGNETEGFIAHELQEYFPDAVTGEKDAVYSSTGNINPQSVDYGRITPLLVKAIQELEARVKELENK